MTEPAAELRAVYRLQLTSQFGFDAARARVPYLRDLGISHLYLSPSFQARPGSTHGYDVVDPHHMSDALGGDEGFRELAAQARAAGLGIVLDIVPNHMGVDESNRYWSDPALREKFFDVDPVTGRHRRFFDIDDLAAIRVEDPDVFEETHELALSLVRSGLVDGLRVDHPDGLADPAGYLERLSRGGAARVWVEKILDPGERLRDWPVSGTVGYEFLNDVCALFVDRRGEAALSALWRSVSGDGRQFGEVALEAKLEQASSVFSPEVERLQRELGGDPAFDVPTLARAVSALPVYRSYVEPWSGRVAEEDRRALAEASLPDELRAMLLLERDAPAAFVTRFQQTTPAIMAKGVEDTAFYRYARLLALNDVGGDPSRFGISVDAFHAGNRERAERFPLNLVTTMTHDAKRSGDVRLRIAALASMPDEWEAVLGRLFAATDELRSSEGAPDDVERLFIFQTLVGAWPIEQERVQAYMEKALREAKRNTNWIEQNTDWEEAVGRFCAALYSHEPFLTEFEPFAERVAAIGDEWALRQLALKLTVPGVPDIYQGDELPYRALVDPDNRRPVDWDWYGAMLRRLMGGSPPDRETMKLFLTLRLLGCRGRRPEAFSGGYEPLDAGDDACAFLRGDELFVAVSVRPPGEASGSVEIPGGRWHDVLTGTERSFDRRTSLDALLGDGGLCVYERAG